MKTITSLLYTDEPAGRLQMENALRKLPAVQAVMLFPGVLAAISKDILEFLRMPVGDLALSAYQRYQRIEDAKRETAASFGRQVVQLMAHKIKNELEPRVEIEINGVAQTIISLELSTELSVESVMAVVESGRLVDIAPGSATVEVSLSAAGVELARAETQPVDLSVPEEAKVLIDLTAMGKPVVDDFLLTGPPVSHPRRPTPAV